MEPLAALVALAAVALALSLYAGVLEASLPGDSDRTAAVTADRALAAVAPDGVARPARLADALVVAPEGYRLNATLTTGDRRWTAGPDRPPDRDGQRRQVAVRPEPGRVRPGALRVVVWS